MARLHINEILDELLSLMETNLKTSLNLQGVYRGGLEWLPPNDLTSMVNGIWIKPSLTTDIATVQMPKALQMTYRFRIVLVRRMDLTNNVLKTKTDDAESIVEMIYDNFQLPNLSLTGGQVLWCLPISIEWEPEEDSFTAALSADLTATAFLIEVQVRTRI